jgi:hypothetical protein
MARSNYDFETDVRVAAVDEDAEWQRVNSYVADVLKDSYVLFAKLARLRGDFAGSELVKLDSISTKVRDVGQALSRFSKSFTSGEFSMDKKEQFGNEGTELSPGLEPTAEDFDFSAGEQGEGPEPEEFETPEEGEGPEPEEFETPEEGEGPEPEEFETPEEGEGPEPEEFETPEEGEVEKDKKSEKSKSKGDEKAEGKK